jgi:Tfp pilus assembly protein PilO
MNVKNRQEFLVMLTIVVAGLYVAVNFIFTPLQGWWSTRQTQIKELRLKVTDGRQLVKRETFIRDNWDGKRNLALPGNTSLAEQRLLKSFDSWASSSGAQLTSLMPQWKNDSTNYMTLSCRVEASGSLGTLSRFLYEVERGTVPLRLDTVELSTRDSAGQQLTLGLEVNGLALIQPEKKAEEKK